MGCDDEPEAEHVVALAAFVLEDLLREQPAGPAAEPVELSELFLGDAPGVARGGELIPAVLQEAEEAEKEVPAEDDEEGDFHGAIVAGEGVARAARRGWGYRGRSFPALKRVYCPRGLPWPRP